MASRSDKKDITQVLDKIAQKRSRRIVTGKVSDGRRTVIMSVGRQGRYVKYRTPSDPGGNIDLAILPTIKAAVMRTMGGKLEIIKRDFREKVRRRKISSLLCIVFDASSSMLSEGKMVATKQVVNDLLLDAYQKRDRIALVTFSGKGAKVALGFTSGVEQGKQAIDNMEFGGTTPLAAGLRAGYDLLLKKAKSERETVATLIVITDGISNTSTTLGEEVGDELERVAREIRDSAANVVVVDVNQQSDDRVRRLATLTGGVYFQPETEETSAEFQDFYLVEKIREKLQLSLANPQLGGILLKGVNNLTVKQVLAEMEGTYLEVDAIQGCIHNCDPDRPESFCRHCTIRYQETKAEEIPRTQVRIPVVRYHRRASREDLVGIPWIHHVIEGSMLKAADRGILFIENIDLLAVEHAAVIGEALTRGFVPAEHDGIAAPYPTRFFVLGTLSPRGLEVPAAINSTIFSIFDTAELNPLVTRVKTMQEIKQYEMDPENYPNVVSKRRDAQFLRALQVRATLGELVLDENSRAVLHNSLAEFDIDTPENQALLEETARTITLLRGHDKPKSEDIEEAVVLFMKAHVQRAGIDAQLLERDTQAELVDTEPVRDLLDELLGDATDLLEGVDGEGFDYIDLDEVERILDTLALRLINPSLGNILFRGFSMNSVVMAIQELQAHGFEIKCIAGCQVNCDPAEGRLCPSCHQRVVLGVAQEVSIPLPLIRFPLFASPEDIRGSLFVRSVIRPGLAAMVNRGLMFINGIDLLEDDQAETLAELLIRRENVLTNGDFQLTHRSDFGLVGIISIDDAQLPPALANQFQLVVEKAAEDEITSKLTTLRQLKERANYLERLTTLTKIRRGLRKNLVTMARNNLTRIELAESELDLVGRLCNELGLAGNRVDFQIAEVARTLAAFRFHPSVSEEDIEDAIKMCVPPFRSPHTMESPMELREVALERL